MRRPGFQLPMREAFALALAAVVLVVPASAHAAIYMGKASDGTRVKLRTNVNGKPKRVVFGNHKARCSHGYPSIKNPIIGFMPPFTAVSRERLVDRGRIRRREGEIKVKAGWNFEASHTARDRWRGRYRSKGVFIHDGEPYTRCSTRFSFDLARR